MKTKTYKVYKTSQVIIRQNLLNVIQVKSILLLFCIAFSFQVTAQGWTLFNDNYLHEIRFENVDTLTFINTKNYQSVKMTVDGVTTNNIGLKQKGNISASHGNNKMPLKVKTNEYVGGQEYDGIREFTLNNSFQDPSMMREKMTFDISKQMGLYGLRTAYAKVYMDNIYWGVYTIVEGKDEMFKHVFNNRGGDAIESTDFGNLCYNGANRSDYWNSNVGDIYIVDNGDETTAWNRLISMLDKANNTPNATYVSTVYEELNIYHFVDYQALNVYLLNFDSYIGYIGNQLYYYDEDADKWQVIPWDFNASMGLWNTNNYGPTTYPLMPPTIKNGCVASFIDTNPILNTRYHQAMCNLTSYLADTVTINSKVDKWRTQIKAAVYSDWRKEFTNTDFDNATAYGYYWHNGEQVPAIKTFAKDRYTTITQDLQNANFTCATSTDLTLKNVPTLTIFPNPATDELQVAFDKNIWGKQITYQFLDLNGRLLQSERLIANSIDLNKLQTGLFVLKCFDEKGNVAVKKVMITE